jgi:hypothetical protein
MHHVNRIKMKLIYSSQQMQKKQTQYSTNKTLNKLGKEGNLLNL